MTSKLSVIAFVLGLGITLWMGVSVMDSNWLAAMVMVMIAGVFITGFAELRRYQRDTLALNQALHNPKEAVDDLEGWLQPLPPALVESVRLRIQGDRVLLPLPILTPYLVGLLVMLGLLGTFAGMVDTLSGAVAALQGTAELEAIRAGLVAPIAGLGLAFGTSVAGISASALLGFIATLSRRQRALATQLLDGKINGIFKAFSPAYHREQTLQALQQQSAALPQVADKLISLADHLEQLGSTLSEQLLANQTQFHQQLNTTYTALATSVDQSLQQSVKDSGQQVSASIQPIMTDLAERVSHSMSSSHRQLAEQLSETVEQQLQQASQSLATTAAEVAGHWQQGLTSAQSSSEQLMGHITDKVDQLRTDIQGVSQDLLTDFGRGSEQWLARQQQQDQQRQQQWDSTLEQSLAVLQQSATTLANNSEERSQHLLQQLSSLLQSTEQLVAARTASEAQWLGDYEQRMQRFNDTITTQLSELRAEEASRGAAALERLEHLQGAVAEHLQTLGCALEAPMTRLIATASETPRAAAEVISQLRKELTSTVERDNLLLEERQQIFERLHLATDQLQQSSSAQSTALSQLVSQTADSLQGIREGFMAQMDSQGQRLNGAVDDIASSAIELSSLGDAFGLAVEHFGQSNREVTDMLAQIESSLQSSAQRSDEQLAYYIAQAREIIDHTVLSQQEMVAQFRQLAPDLSVSA